jgi:hypothetical protein
LYKKLLNPLLKFFRNKTISTAFTPTYDAAARQNRNYGEFRNFVAFTNRPYWQPLTGFASIFKWFATNPVLYAVVMIKARESANMRYVVHKRGKPDEIEPENTRKDLPRKIYQIMGQPNPLQSKWEWLLQRKVLFELAGNSFTYGNAPLGFKPTIENIQTMFNVWPQYMNVMLTGKYFEATELSEIISGWKFQYNQYKKEFRPDEIFLRSGPNLGMQDGLILGRPTAAGLVKPLSNIEMGYESRNVIMRNRGMRAIISSDKGDASGSVPFLPQERTEMQEDFADRYGTLEDQWQWLLTGLPVNVTPIDQDVMKLGLFEEIATDAMIVCHAFGVPEILLKLYLQGATFENQSESVKRLYNGTLIPEAEAELTAFNNWLGLTNTDWELSGSWDHIPGLQRSEADRSSANRNASLYLKDLFMVGAITHNQWLIGVEMEPYGPEGDKRIWDFDDRQLAIIMRSTIAVQADNQQQNQNGNGQNGQNGQNGNGNGQNNNGDKFNFFGFQRNGHRAGV